MLKIWKVKNYINGITLNCDLMNLKLLGSKFWRGKNKHLKMKI